MTQIKNNINTYADLTAYNADTNKDYPNISYIQASDEVKYSNPVVYATFNVSSPTKVTVTCNPAAFAKIELNGQEIELVDTYNYDFGARGTYTLKYTLASETAIPNKTWGWCNELISMTDIPKTITSIGQSAFLGCKFTSFTIPSGVRSIGDSAFSGCQRLTSVTIPNSVTSIGASAFGNCTALTNVTIGSGVTSISYIAFEYCGDTTNKCTFTILATTPPTLANNDIFTIGRTEAIYVPAESVNTYKSASRWSTYASLIQAIPTT